MRILCSMPGKYGDIMWSLPTARAIAETFDCAVDFMVSGAYGSIAPLIQAQEYIEQAIVRTAWEVRETAPMTPWAAPLSGEELESYDHVFDLGYRGWPTEKTLAGECYKNFRERMVNKEGVAPLDLERPWIKAVPIMGGTPYVFVGWNEQWIELKMGVTLAVLNRCNCADYEFILVYPPGKVRHEEWTWIEAAGLLYSQSNWLRAADLMAGAACYFGCLSSQWVLANAMGKKTVVMEPDPDRARNPLFWLDSPRNRMVIGGDGLSTHDARHTGDLLREVLEGLK